MKTDTAPTDSAFPLTEAARLRNEAFIMKDRIQLLEENLKNRELNLDKLEDDVSSMRDKLFLLRNREVENQNTIRDLRLNSNDREKRISELVTELIALRKQPSCAALNEELRTTHAAHRRAVLKWDAAVKQADTYRRHWDAKSNEVENEQRYNRQLKQQVFDLEVRNGGQISLLASRDADLTRLSVEINNLRNTVKETQPTVSFWRRKAEEASHEAVSLKEKDRSAENALIKKVQLLQDQLKEAEQKHDAYKKKVLEAGYSPVAASQSKELQRLKNRVNSLLSAVNNIGGQNYEIF